MELQNVLLFVWFLSGVFTMDTTLDVCVPRKTVPYHRDHFREFREEGVWNYSTMLLREDLGLLLLGARDNIYALDINDISKKMTSVSWKVTAKQQKECSYKGKDPEVECQNFIRILHTMEDGRMYVCGTNAFNPECDFMSYVDKKLILEDKKEDGKGKCPFDPFQRYSSIMIGKDLYSATSMNFLGSEPIIMRSSLVSVRTEFKSSWLHEPNFVSMAQMPHSESGEEDDKVYLFFSETAVEYDFYSKLIVSRVAHVCKGDLGGQRTLQKKWTSFLKARVDCPVKGSQLPYIIQDTFLWCDPEQGQKSCLFYAVFTPQADTTDLSAVCAYRVEDISRVFSEGKYKTPVTVETSFVKWVMYSGDVPSPRPGACIDEKARRQGINSSLELPDRTLQFIRDRPLMDQAVLPLGEGPLLVRRGPAFTRIIVHTTQALDGEKYHVMFIGTAVGSVLKALSFKGEMFIIEEVQLFQPPEPIKVLKFSSTMGELYAGSELGAVQMQLASCGRSQSCLDCVLSRDPYCGWDRITAQCTSLSPTHSDLIQSVKKGDASLCPDTDPVKPVNVSVWLGGNPELHCPPSSNLAKTSWLRDGLPLPSTPRHQILHNRLIILNITASDTARYHCVSKEPSHTGEYTSTVADYLLRITGSSPGDPSSPQAQREGPNLAALQASVGLLVVLLTALLGWNFYKGHLPLLPCSSGRGTGNGLSQREAEQDSAVSKREEPEAEEPEVKALVPQVNFSGNNNHPGVGGEVSSLNSLQYIDESEM